jgi:hypothetical protein
MNDRLLGICLIALLIVFIVQRKYFAYKSRLAEGFRDVIPNLNACPSGTKEFNTLNSVDCCDGDIEGTKCKGRPVCTLSQRSGDLVRCVDYVGIRSVEQGMISCPTSMPNYFEKDRKGFCTNGALNRAKNGPVNQDAKTCAIFSNQQERMNNPNSCFNQKLMDDMKFTIANVPYEKIIASRRGGIVLGATYEVDGKFESCLDRNSFERREDATKPGWRSDTDSNTRAYYNSLTFCA